jgi:FlaA1/EpsC-like NDP-sugar epimerase
MNKHLFRLKSIQIVIDGLLIINAFALAYFLRIGFIMSTDFPFGNYMLIALITTPITLTFMFFARAYKLTQQVHTLRHMQRIAFVAIVNVAVFMVLYYFAYRNFFSRLILVYIFLLTFAFIYFWHRIFRWILAKSAEKEVGVYRTLIVGANRPAEEIIKHLLKTKSHIKPVAIIDAHGSKKDVIAGIPVVGKMNVFEKAIAQHDIDHILQTDHLEHFQGHQKLEEIEGQPFIKVYRKKKWWDKIW